MTIAPEHLAVITGGEIVKVHFLLLADIFECVYTSEDGLSKSVNIPAGDIQALLLEEKEPVVNQEQLLPFKEAIMRRLGRAL